MIRLWTLGSLEYKIFPSKEAVQKLADILLNNSGEGPVDIVWGPDLSVKLITDKEILEAKSVNTDHAKVNELIKLLDESKTIDVIRTV